MRKDKKGPAPGGGGGGLNVPGNENVMIFTENVDRSAALVAEAEIIYARIAGCLLILLLIM
jgi:hypothetical protein